MELGAIILWSIVGAMVWLGLAHAKSEAQQQAAATAAQIEQKRRALAEQLEFIHGTQLLRPDGRAVLAVLKTRYSWEQLLQTVGLLLLDLELIAQATSRSPLELANWEHPEPGPLERASVKVAVRAAQTHGLLGGGPLQEQEPTTRTLKSLVDRGYLLSDRPITSTTREYLVSSTVEGRHLLSLHDTFADHNWSPPRFWTSDPSIREALRIAVVDSIETSQAGEGAA